MHKFFIEGELSGEVYLSPADVRHAKDVLRLKRGDSVRLADRRGNSAEAAILSLDGGAVRLLVVRRLPQSNEAPVRLVLGQGLGKGGKMDFICQKAAELGAHEILPLSLQHSVVRYDNAKMRDKQARWQKIAREAAQQCGRDLPPAVGKIQSLEQALTQADCELKLLFYEQEQAIFLRPLMRSLIKPPASVLLLIGAEGGFSAEEIRQAAAAGCKSVSLGTRVLRTETAAVAALAVLMYELGGLEAYDV